MNREDAGSDRSAAMPDAPETLDEKVSRELLSDFGIPFVNDMPVANAAAAVAAADRIGYPVVVKGRGRRLLHKTELGAVRTHLRSAAEVSDAVAAIQKTAGDRLEGFLVQPHVSARRELMAGLFRDREFGPVVMVGWGGIFAEPLNDVALRLAPLDVADARAMLDEILAAGILGAFRGESPVDRDSLVQILLSLSRLAVEHPEIREVDINPLLVRSDGRLLGVDALVVKSQPAAAVVSHPVLPQQIGALFHPKSVAFVGASSQFGKWGHMLAANTIGSGFDGAVYLVNPKGGTLFDRPVYPSVSDIPSVIDLAVVTLPAARILDLIPELGRKRIRYVVLITSGFGETGASGRQLEDRLVQEARKHGMLILGPNTMGISNPHIGFYCTGSPVTPPAGSTAVVAQSGNMGTQLLAFAEQQGVGIRGFAGSGNEAMLTIEDYLDGFELDRLTQTVMLYVESVKNGRRFFESAKRVGRQKPVVLLKGGQTPEGNRAASSHTGALATDTAVFDAMCRQAGIVKVDFPMELLDLSAAFSAVPLPAGNRVAIMTLGGGWGVVTADVCSRYGLQVPELSEGILHRLDRHLPPYWSRSNPVDLVGETDLDLPLAAMEALLDWDGCDAVVHLGILGRRLFVERLTDTVAAADPDHSSSALQEIRQLLVDFEERYIQQIAHLMERYRKPVVGVRLLTAPEDRTVYTVAGCRYQPIFYETPERAVRALSKMVDYRRFLREDAAEKGNSLPDAPISGN